MKFLCFAALGLINTISFSVFAQESCQAIFNKTVEDVNVLELALGLEERLNSFYSLNYSSKSDRQIAEQELLLLSSKFEVIVSNLDSIGLRKQLIADISELNTTISRLEEQLKKTEVQAAKVTTDANDLRVVIKSPFDLKPDTLYNIHGTDILVQRVSFSKDILEDIFWTDKENLIVAHDLILKALIKGRTNATNSSGVENFAEDRSIFKLKIVGHGIGSLRLAGYMKGSDLYLVTYLDSEHHNQGESHRLFKKVRNAIQLEKK